ncbi:hypothetical protein M8998_01205 [Sphingobacterium sp. lm-10]|uniref:hypothetical protein n=1 Tax=Sphingobacterium sp. lm-10 TaxID=2944904 RepID=UPI0020201959|nr:hypothetical protein [Sphingobacterium sp. lm-10]MCL7986547.1 hypothetical protein [Sphingobacterium sp. lm-10]
MKKTSIFLLAAVATLTFQACQKDDPVPETDQEEVGTATLIFTEVHREAHGDHFHYHDEEGGQVETVEFTTVNGQLVPQEGHVHLSKGKTYRLDLQSTDFLGRRSEQTFVTRDDIHQVFFATTPASEISKFRYEYGDENAAGQNLQVGVTGYLTVLETSNTFVMRYVMRHLNPGVKANITAADWNNPNFLNFAGATDLDLRFEMHFVDGAGHGH